MNSVKSRKAQIGDKLNVANFGTGTVGFADPAGSTREVLRVDNENCVTVSEPCMFAVCLLPGTEIAFDAPIEYRTHVDFCNITHRESSHAVAVFCQINKDTNFRHHDALELPDGTQILLTDLKIGQTATVLQLPAIPNCPEEAEAQTRLEYVGD